MSIQEKFSFKSRSEPPPPCDPPSASATQTSSNIQPPVPTKMPDNNLELPSGLPTALSRTFDSNSWQIIANQEDEFRSQIHKFVMYRGEVFVITIHDRVYGLGTNENNLLGLGHKDACFVPQEIKELRCRQVIDIRLGKDLGLALTKTGQVYQWGGILSPSEKLTRPKLVPFNVNIMAIDCSEDFCVALDIQGRVHSWGKNACGQLGHGNTEKQAKPVPIKALEFSSPDRKIVQLACGAKHCLALTNKGQVWSWGSNDKGQLGVETTEPYFLKEPIAIEKWFPSEQQDAQGEQKYIRAVAAGSDSSLALTTTDQLYSTYNDNKRPECLHLNGKQVAAIFLDYHSDLAVAYTCDKHFYVWGAVKQLKEVSKNPSQTTGPNIGAIYAFHGKKTTPGMLKAKEIILSSRSSDVQAEHFNDPKVSKLELKFSNGKSIFVDQKYLKDNSKHFEALLKSEDANSQTMAQDCDYEVYFLYLALLYGYPLAAQKHSTVNNLNELINLASIDSDTKVIHACVQAFATDVLNVSNCCDLFAIAQQLERQQFIQQIGTFIVHNSENVCKTEAFKQMESSHAKSLLKYVFSSSSIVHKLKD